MGQTRKGCWVVHGREGVYYRKPIATKELENRTELSDGAGPFADTREKKSEKRIRKRWKTNRRRSNKVLW